MRALIALFLGAVACVPGLAAAESVNAVAARYHLAGELLVARGNRVLLDRGYGPVAPGGSQPHRAGERWRLASITKQVTATLILRHVPEMPAALDSPLSRPGLEKLTLRQLLTHHSGLANPDATAANAAGVPAFYTAATPNLAYCTSQPAKPGAAFAYNNCDYILAAQSLGGRPHWPAGMRMAAPGMRLVEGYVGSKTEPAVSLASYGASGGLTSTAHDLYRFDRDLMAGKTLPPASLSALWKPEGAGSYQALGQWVFPGRFEGCAAPKRIVQRDGEIYGVQTRNYILPDDGIVVIAFTNRSADDFAFGEVWQGKGFAYDLLSAVACA